MTRFSIKCILSEIDQLGDLLGDEHYDKVRTLHRGIYDLEQEILGDQTERIAELEAQVAEAMGCIRKISESERIRMYQSCPDCDHPRVCDPTKTCRIKSGAQEEADALLARTAQKEEA